MNGSKNYGKFTHITFIKCCPNYFIKNFMWEKSAEGLTKGNPIRGNKMARTCAFSLGYILSRLLICAIWGITDPRFVCHYARNFQVFIKSVKCFLFSLSNASTLLLWLQNYCVIHLYNPHQSPLLGPLRSPHIEIYWVGYHLYPICVSSGQHAVGYCFLI